MRACRACAAPMHARHGDREGGKPRHRKRPRTERTVSEHVAAGRQHRGPSPPAAGSVLARIRAKLTTAAAGAAAEPGAQHTRQRMNAHVGHRASSQHSRGAGPFGHSSSPSWTHPPPPPSSSSSSSSRALAHSDRRRWSHTSQQRQQQQQQQQKPQQRGRGWAQETRKRPRVRVSVLLARVCVWALTHVVCNSNSILP